MAALAALETERLTLRPLADGDAPFILELLGDPDWLRFIGDKHVRTEEDALRYIRDGPVAMYARCGFGLLRVGLKEDDTPVGLCGLIKRDTLPDVDIGFAFLPRFRGRGLALEAARASLDQGRRVLGLARVVAICSPHNAASVRLLTRLGLRFERAMKLGDDEVSLFASAS